MRVLLIEADPEVAARLQRGLAVEGLVVRTVPASGDAGPIDEDVVLIGLPDEDRLTLCRALRVGRPGRRVLMLTPDASERQRVAALEAGADDALAREGVSVRELAVRLRALGRRAVWSAWSEALIDAPTSSGRLRLDPEERRVEVDGREVRVTPTELGLLLALARRPGRAFDRATLLHRVWGGRPVTPRTLDSVVKRLRARLGDAGELIETVRGVGYRLRDDPAESPVRR